MAINPGYNQFPRQRVPQISAGINSSNVQLVHLKEQEDAAIAAKLAAKKTVVVAVPAPLQPTPIPSVQPVEPTK